MAEPEDPLVPVFVPSLATMLLQEEEVRGRALTEREVLAIRDQTTIVLVPRSQAKKMDDSRGHQDLDPENCWQQYLELRKSQGRDA
jgi:hypothetical protein